MPDKKYNEKLQNNYFYYKLEYNKLLILMEL